MGYARSSRGGSAARHAIGQAYPPFHDVQIAVAGEAARSLGELARDRWQRATGQVVHRSDAMHDPWPDSLAPDVRDVVVGVSRTQPSSGGRPEIREVEALYHESIATAKRSIYIENQYLTSPRIGQWLEKRLAEPEGPEILIVGPRENSGWLEENTMGALRDRLVQGLRDADLQGRLRVFYPHLDDLPADQIVNVHSKVMVVDDDFVRVGSSNLSNRSLGLDTECDISLHANGDRRVREAITGFRNNLLAEHLGSTAEDVKEAIDREDSLVRAIDTLRGGPRSLEPLVLEANPRTAYAIDALGTVVDPEHPVPLEELLAWFEEDERPLPMRRWRLMIPHNPVSVHSNASLLRANPSPPALPVPWGAYREILENKSSRFAPVAYSEAISARSESDSLGG